MNDKPISTRTRGILTRYGIRLKKSLGQNFLTNTHVLDKIIDAADLTEESGVVEIGPGIGALTERLAHEAKKVVAVEVDQRLIPVLQELLKTESNVEIIHGDAINVDFAEIVAQYFQEVDPIHVVANLPYYITSPIIIRLLEDKIPFRNIIIMIQKELAERLIAQPGTKDYSSLSVWVQYFAQVEVVAWVPSDVFVPRPKVDSAIVKLTLLSQPSVQVADETLFFKLVRASFAQRRKTLLNTLQSNLFPTYSKQEIESWLLSNAIDPKRRGETLELEGMGCSNQSHPLTPNFCNHLAM